MRTLDSSRHLGFWTLMEVVGGWWLWFVPDRGEGNNIQSSPKEQNKRKKNVEEKKSNTYIEGERETVHSRKCARARVFTFSPFVVVPLLFDATQDETRNSSCLYTSSPSPSFSSSSFQKKPNRQRSRRALKSVNDRKKKERKKGLDKRFKWTKREALVFFFSI